MKKRVIILGSTGSIGRATLEVIEGQMDSFEVVGLVCRGNLEMLKTQIEKFRPAFICLFDGPSDRITMKRGKLLTGMEGIKELIRMDADIVVNALPGSIGLEPTIETLRSGKILALANKESLVMAGRIIKKLTEEGTGRLIPVDSEHSAVFQLLNAFGRHELAGITITASGGPFREHTKEALQGVKPEQALNHPTWKMGQKVTLDSATLVNKGLEVIEARWLFNIEPSRIKVLIHPESIVHGMIDFTDGSSIAYMSYPDMKLPIAYALNEEKRTPLPLAGLRLEEVQKLTFYPPDLNRFPSLRLAFEALESGDSAAIALNTANEVASAAFVERKIKFTEIPVIIEETIAHHPVHPVIETLEGVRDIHMWAKEYTEGVLGRHYV